MEQESDLNSRMIAKLVRSEWKMELVSAVITTYKGSENIVRAVESCLSQSYPEIEIIVVDDNGEGSDEQVKTFQVLKDYILSEKIRYIPHHENKNGSVARNTGARAARGSFIAFLDDDDAFEKDKIRLQVKAFDEAGPKVGVVYCSRLNLENGVPKNIKTASYNGKFTYEYLMARVSACTSSIMVRADDYWKVNGFDESYRRHQDWEFMVRLSTVTEIKSIDYIGVKKYCQNIVKRFKPAEAEKYRIYFLDKLKPIISSLPISQQKDVYAYHYNEIAKLYFRTHEYNHMISNLKKGEKPYWFVRDTVTGTFVKLFRKTGRKFHIVPVIKG